IQCNYCNRRYDCINESRPGVTSTVLSPEDAVEKVGTVLSAVPRLTVIGIAGPGDPLANPEKTFRTFELIKKAFPDLKLCFSTNGLMLPDYLDEVKELGIDHVTITINAVDPAVAKGLYRWVFYKGKTYRGEEGAALLLEMQQEGLRGLTERHILCKVNTILMPGMNDHHIPEVAKTVKKMGAFLVNLMPLIPVAGTPFEKLRAPTPKERRDLQDLLGIDVRQMRHCRQCRADAVGLLGQDLSTRLASHPLASGQGPDLEKRQRTLDKVTKEIERQRRVREELERDEAKEERQSMLVAVATKGNGLVNLHFGHAREFMIYEITPEYIRFVEARNVERYCYGPAGYDDSSDSKLEGIIQMLGDCGAVLCSRIGSEPAARLKAAGINCYMVYDVIEKAVDQVARGGLKPAWA
ncbi:MAG TPA: nitrogenase cofactor biosynthesis protein NifB, partial [Dehalococcoidia bacterium]|nr:nitrogenase cofactor biosynthesis protein NifB [Dehalococcoidia bacterium]